MVGYLPRIAAPPLRVALLAILGVGIGAAVSTSIPLTASIFLILLLAYLFSRSSLRSEVLVAAYWLSFCVYETVFAAVTIPGFFYPFYAAFMALTLVSLAGPGVRFDGRLTATYAGFLFIVLTSFVGFANPVDFQVASRLVAYCFAGLVMLQIASARGAWLVIASAVLASAIIATWVVWTSVTEGFAYRGSIDVNQNAVTLFIALGLVPLLATITASLVFGRRRALILPLTLASAILSYAVLLLASRGMTIAITVAIVAVVVRSTVMRPRVIVPILAILLVVFAVGLALPGGTSLFERFEGEQVESGNTRYLLWETTLGSFTEGSVSSFLFGNGFDSSKDVLRREFGSTTSTHNGYIQILYEFGLIGLALFVALHITLLIRASRMRNELGLILLGLVVFLMGANLPADASNGFMYWATLGLLIGAVGLAEPAQSTASHPAPPSPSPKRRTDSHVLNGPG